MPITRHLAHRNLVHHNLVHHNLVRRNLTHRHVSLRYRAFLDRLRSARTGAHAAGAVADCPVLVLARRDAAGYDIEMTVHPSWAMAEAAVFDLVGPVLLGGLGPSRYQTVHAGGAAAVIDAYNRHCGGDAVLALVPAGTRRPA